MNIDEITFLAIIYRSKLTTIISGAELVIVFDIDVKTCFAVNVGN